MRITIRRPVSVICKGWPDNEYAKAGCHVKVNTYGVGSDAWRPERDEPVPIWAQYISREKGLVYAFIRVLF